LQNSANRSGLRIWPTTIVWRLRFAKRASQGLGAACAGYGLAQLQDYFVDSAIAQGKLVSVLDRFKPKIEPIWLVYPQNRHLTPTVRAFVDFMAAQFRPRQTKS